MSCEHDCDRPPRFPAVISNRSGLRHFAYRIGDYASMRAHMLDRLVKAPALAGWTHLKADDPGIALLEGAALLADVLTFYQELYANETKLATAHWEENVFDLVRLTGYRPAPGLGGHAVFALELRGEAPVTVPAGFAFQALLEGADKPAIFETSAVLEAWPGLGHFHFYRRREGLQAIVPGTTALDIVRLGNSTALATRAEHGIQAGDRILMLSGPYDPYEIVVVKETEQHLDRVTLHLEGAVQENHPAEVTAYRLGRSFRHYGADAAREFFTFREDPPKTFRHNTLYTRSLNAAFAEQSYYAGLAARELPLDSEVEDLATGSTVICTGRAVLPMARNFAFVRRIERITPRDMLWANATAPVSLVTLNAALTTGAFGNLSVSGSLQAAGGLGLAQQGFEFAGPVAAQPASFQLQGSAGPSSSLLSSAPQHALSTSLAVSLTHSPEFLFGAFASLVNLLETQDIRRLRLHETQGAAMRLRAPPRQKPSLADGKVNFFGTRAEAAALAGRTLLLDGLTEVPEQLVVAVDQPELAAAAVGPPGDRRMWPLALSSVPQSAAAGFAEVDPAVTVYGNIVTASQGERQAETAIGSGDARAIFQTFALPKAPLTFLSDPARTPPYAAELEVRVADRLWQPVDSFFAQPATAEVYVVRADGAGGHVVQFGDGLSGARLPSGRNNVTAAWRIGSGAQGTLAAEQSPKAKDQLQALSKVLLPGPVTGGAAAESMTGARSAAPGRLQSLGRLVGLADYEAEALAVPGVVKVGAVFAADSERPAITLTLLTEDESPAAVAAVAAALRHADRCRGPARYPLDVVAGRRRYLHLALQLGYDPAYRSADLDAAVSVALGALPLTGQPAADTGLFALSNRRFAQDVHISQAIAAVQSINGVQWVKPTAFCKLPASSDDPADLSVPAKPGLAARLTVSASEVLVLSELHLTLVSHSLSTDQECAE